MLVKPFGKIGWETNKSGLTRTAINTPCIAERLIIENWKYYERAEEILRTEEFRCKQESPGQGRMVARTPGASTPILSPTKVKSDNTV